MDINLNKSTPRHIQLGTEDRSAQTLPAAIETRPQNYPLFMIFTGRGKEEPTHVASQAFFERNFGRETLDTRGKFYNHHMHFLTTMMGEANAAMVRRLIPEGAKKAFLRISVEVLFDNIENIARDPHTGMYRLDSEGVPIPVDGAPTIPGYRLRWLANYQTDTIAFGAAAPLAGTWASSIVGPDGTTPLTSQIYPVMDLEINTEGYYGDNIGIRLVPASFTNGDLDYTTAFSLRSLMLTLQTVERDTATQTPVIQRTLGGSTQLTLAMLEDQFDPRTNDPVSINTAFVDAYDRHNVPGQPNVLGPFGRVHQYDHWKTVQDMLIAPAVDVQDSGVDYDGESSFDEGNYPGGIPDVSFARTDLLAVNDEDNARMLNIFTGRDADLTPYFGFVVDEESLTFTINANHYATGGADGDVSFKAFDLAYRAACRNFGEEEKYPMKNFVKYPFSSVWDSGFSVNTKLSMANIIGVRHDVFPIFTTFTQYGATNSATEQLEVSSDWEYKAALDEDTENAVGEQLLQRIKMTPESEYFGTPAFRAMIFGQSGQLLSSVYQREMPISIQYAVAMARFAGASNGRWRRERNPNVGDNKKITMFRSVSNTFASPTQQDRAWGACINKARDYDTSSYFWPALTTVYEDKTSVMFNPNMAWAANTMYKICYWAWRDFVGDDSRSGDQLVKDSDRRINQYVNESGIFAGIVTTIPETIITPDDSTRGYTWHTDIHMGTNEVRLVGVYSIKANRLSDMFL